MELGNAEPENVFINSEVHYHNQIQTDIGITSQEFNKKKLEIQKWLLETARLSSQVDQNLPSVQLTTCNPIDNNNDLEHFDRDQILNLTRNLNGNIKLEDIFLVSKLRAIQAANQNNLDDVAYDRYVEKHSNFISFIGPAGSGKTTLSNILVQKLLNKENTILPDIEYLFYIKLQYVNYDDKLNILQFFATSMQNHLEPMSKELTKLVLDDISSSRKCVFLFDGLNDTTFKLSKTAPFVNIYESKAKAENFVKNIFSGKLFPKSLKIITSQNYHIVELHPNYKPSLNVYILGLNRDGISEVCRLKVGENHSNVMNFLETNYLLLDVCYLPAYCNCLMECVSKIADDHGSLRLHSPTSILLSMLMSFCRSSHMCSKEKWLEHLTQLAYHGVFDEKFTFEKNDLVRVGIKWKNVESFLNVFLLEELGSMENVFQEDIKTSFYHIIIQEIFCAVHIMSFISFTDFKTIIPRLTEKRFKVVAKLLYGMGSKTVRKQMKALFGLNLSFHKKRDYLIEYACSRVKDIKKAEQYPQGPHLFSWLKEMDEAKFVDSFIPLLPSHIGILNEICPEDVSCYSYLLKATRNSISLYIAPDFLGNSCSRFLSEVLSLIHHKLNIEICWMRIRAHPLTTDDVELICSCLGRIRELSIEECDITDQHISMLKQTRKLNSKKTKILGVEGIENNFLRSQSFRHSRKDLSFRDNVISREGSRIGRFSRQLSRDDTNCTIS